MTGRLGRVSPRAWRIALIFVGLAIVVLALAACGSVAPAGPTLAPGATPSPAPTPAPTPVPEPLVPAQPGTDPVETIAWIFNPIFQAIFILLVAIDQVTGDIGLAIIGTTLVIRVLLIPLFRKQLVSQRRMQLLAPELKEIQKRFKGDRARITQEQQRLYQERGINPLSGCLPTLLQLPLLMIMYSVISQGLTNYNPNAMLNVFGVQLIELPCSPVPLYTPGGQLIPCINPFVPWLGGLNVSQPQVVNITLLGFAFGLSILAVVSALLQVVQTRMVLTTTGAAAADSQSRAQNQVFLVLPLISVLYGGVLAAGLFIYWIVTTVFSIVQQYLIVGFGGLFPVFGWTPRIAQGHVPRFPVSMPTPRDATASPQKAAGPAGPAGRAGKATPPPRLPADRATAADRTIRPRERGRQGRRGRRR